jgi:hypothetical protein
MHSKAPQTYLIPITLPMDKNNIREVLWGVDASKDRVHLLAVIENIGGFDLNKIMLDFKNVKMSVEEKGFSCTAELIKVMKGDESKEDVIRDYVKKMNATLLS